MYYVWIRAATVPTSPVTTGTAACPVGIGDQINVMVLACEIAPRLLIGLVTVASAPVMLLGAALSVRINAAVRFSRV